jgi:hypothetical protein
VGAIEHLLVGGVEHFECRHHLARRHGIDLQRAARQFVDALGEIVEVLLQRQAGRPARLHLEHTRLLGSGALCERKPQGDAKNASQGSLHELFLSYLVAAVYGSAGKSLAEHKRTSKVRVRMPA